MFGTPPASLDQVDPSWVAEFLAENSSVRLDDIRLAAAHDGGAPLQMLCFGLQASPSMRLPVECRVKHVLAYVLKERLVAAGSRLNSIQSALNDGKLTWVVGVFKCHVNDDGDVYMIGHCNGDTCLVPAGCGLDWERGIAGNLSDLTASMARRQPALPPVVLADLFKAARSGPWRAPSLWPAGKAFASRVSAAYEHWLDTRSDGHALGSDSADRVGADAMDVGEDNPLAVARRRAAAELLRSKHVRILRVAPSQD